MVAACDSAVSTFGAHDGAGDHGGHFDGTREAWGATERMSEKTRAGEPSMDEILASIRRIISDDDGDTPTGSNAKAAQPARMPPPAFDTGPAPQTARTASDRRPADPFAEQLAATLERPVERRFAPVRDELMDLLVDRDASGPDRSPPPPPAMSPQAPRAGTSSLMMPSAAPSPQGEPSIPRPMPLGRGAERDIDASAGPETAGTTGSTTAKSTDNPAQKPAEEAGEGKPAVGSTSSPMKGAVADIDAAPKPSVGFIPTAASISPIAPVSSLARPSASQAMEKASARANDDGAREPSGLAGDMEVAEAPRDVRGAHASSSQPATSPAFPLPPARQTEPAFGKRMAAPAASAGEDRKTDLLAEADIAKQARSALEKLAKGLATMTGAAPATRPKFDLPPAEEKDAKETELKPLPASVAPAPLASEHEPPAAADDAPTPSLEEKVLAAMADREDGPAEDKISAASANLLETRVAEMQEPRVTASLAVSSSDLGTTVEDDAATANKAPDILPNIAPKSIAQPPDANTGQPAPPTAPETASRSLEETVVGMLRPMIKSWLDENLPSLVTKALEQELASRDALPAATKAEPKSGSA